MTALQPPAASEDRADLARRIAALRTDRTLPVVVRAALHIRLRALTGECDVLEWAKALFALRFDLSARAFPQILDAAREVEAMLRAEGHDPGTSALQADALVLRLQRGCWIAAGDTYPEGVRVVLGGMDWTRIHEELAEQRPPAPPDDARGLRVLLNARRRRTPWDVFFGAQSPEVQARLPAVRATVDGDGLVGDKAPEASWNNDHWFSFLDGGALAFSWRAWGDFQVALTGAGHYLDWYG